jgi:hypothetical protein
MTAADVATAVGYGDRPPPRQLRLIAWRPMVKGSLRGFASVELLPTGLQIIDCPVHVSNGRPWAGLPSKAQIADGRQRIDARGKALYTAVLQWRDPELRDRFSGAVVALIRRHHPGALEQH